jgi:shikimate kinase
MRNLVLIGMPGVGKSTIGVVLAKTMGLSFLDTDLMIQKRESRLLHSIISEDGIEGFLKLEEDVLSSIHCSDMVIATGGSAVLSSKAMNHLKELGPVVFLKLDYQSIRKRIRNITTRGIVMGRDQSLLDVFNERMPLYEAYADFTVDCRGLSVEGIVAQIFRQYRHLTQR